MSEQEVRRAIEVYRREHETKDLDALMGAYADNAVFITSAGDRVEGKAAIREAVMRWLPRPSQRFMKYNRVIVAGDEAAVEWETWGKNPDGTDYSNAGAAVFQVEGSKLIYTRIYRGK